MSVRAQRLLVTGLYDLRAVVLALPKLAALRAVSPNHHITVIAPPLARDLLLRLRVADHVRVIDGNAFSTIVWVLWQKISRAFDAVVDATLLREGITLDWQKLARDLMFLLPQKKFITFALPDGWPAVRAAALVRKFMVEGYAVVLLGTADTPAHERLRKAAPDMIDLVGRIDLADVAECARHAHVTIGGRDAMTTLAALSGARTIIVCGMADEAVDVLPHATTTWIQSDDIADISIGDIMKVTG